MVATVAIPWLTGQAIDGLDAGDESDLRRYALLIALAAVVRVALSVARRLVAGRVSLAIEFDLRNLMYRHLQSLEMAFFDQQQTAGCPADVEENVSGIRVVKAFAAEPRQLSRFEHSVTRVFDQSMRATRLRAYYNPFIGFLPMLTGPMRQLGIALGMAQRATASGARLFEILDRAPALTAPAGAPPLPDGARRGDGLGQDDARAPARPALRRHGGRGADRRRRRARRRARVPAARDQRR